jgi:hypothetical protein
MVAGVAAAKPEGTAFERAGARSGARVGEDTEAISTAAGAAGEAVIVGPLPSVYRAFAQPPANCATHCLKPGLGGPIPHVMNGFLHWLLSGAASLVLVAVVVAWWEHLGRAAAQHDAKQPLPPRLATVDVELDALVALGQGTGDVYERRQTLDGAMARMAGVAGSAWTDTAPMIGIGLRENNATTRAAPQSRRDSFEHVL